MCRFYCTSEGPSTNLKCLHCGIYYCGACLHGEKGKMENLIKCAGCGKKPRTADAASRGGWKGDGVNSVAGGTGHVSDSDRTLVNGLRPDHNGTGSKKSASSKGKKGPSIFDKLTDTSLYTGAHKHRFDADGRGRGMAGRDAASGITYDGTGGGLTLSKLADRTPSDARGLPVALSKVTSGGSPPRSKSPAPVRSPSAASSAPRGSGPQYDEEVKPAPKKSASTKGKKGPSIFDKLTDTSLYTGAHKLRFDANGKGRGMAGRDAASGISYDGSGGGLTLSQLANRGAADARGLPVSLKH